MTRADNKVIGTCQRASPFIKNQFAGTAPALLIMSFAALEVA